MATAVDGDSDGSVFEMGFNNWNDAAIADDVRHGRAAPISVKATAAATETTKVLKIEKSVAPLEPQLGREGQRHPVRDRIREFSPRIMEKWKAEDYKRKREQRFGSYEIWFYCILGGRFCVLCA